MSDSAGLGRALEVLFLMSSHVERMLLEQGPLSGIAQQEAWGPWAVGQREARFWEAS